MKRVLIANRGEIAVRIARACREMGVSPIAVYSDCDRAALHVRSADAAYRLGGNSPAESYLRIDRIVEAAVEAGADAVHPGYGFLAENAEFARAVEAAGLVFIGPSPAAIARMGSKTEAREVARRASVPIVPGTDFIGENVPDAQLEAMAGAVGFPLLVKAVAGGGGKGMRGVTAAAELLNAVRAARSEARNAFGDAAVYFERQLPTPRHIEVQILADAHGTVLPFVERECSIQRRHQKVVEETPSTAVTPDLRLELTSAAARLAAAASYTNAGTVEFLVDAAGRFYFLEMNARLQVEHPITELVTGVDLVQWQIRIARGERLTLDAGSLVEPRGHAIECRVYAEDPDAGFLPSPGRIAALRTPAGPWVRDDSAATAGMDVPVYYDPLISKLAVWAEDRPSAIARMRRALSEYIVAGVQTTVPFFVWLFKEPAFVEGRVHTGYLDDVLAERKGRPFVEPGRDTGEVAAIALALHMAMRLQASGAGLAPQSRWRAQARSDALNGFAVRH